MFSLGWAGLYLGGALLVAAVVLVLADRRYTQDQGYRPVHPVMALVIGVLWPVLVIGAAQLLVLHAFRGRRHGRGAPVVELDAARQAAAAARAVPTWRISA